MTLIIRYKTWGNVGQLSNGQGSVAVQELSLPYKSLHDFRFKAMGGPIDLVSADFLSVPI